jgi:hypothetical protein
MVTETNASDFGIRAIFLPVEFSYLKPEALYSRTIDKTEIKYAIHDKEILAIISAF